jgi:uncharacterized protein
MSDKLPNYIDPIYFVNHQKQIHASVSQNQFPRIVASSAVKSAEELKDREVEVELKFYYDKVLKFPAMEMSVKTVLKIECQRSLEPFDFEVSSRIKGVFTESLALVEDLPSEIEVYEIEEEKISLHSLVEDEVLLSLPMAPVNEASRLTWRDEPLPDGQHEEAAVEKADASDNPFAALQALKKDKN